MLYKLQSQVNAERVGDIIELALRPSTAKLKSSEWAKSLLDQKRVEVGMCAGKPMKRLRMGRGLLSYVDGWMVEEDGKLFSVTDEEFRRRYTEVTEDELFYRLYYRERVGRLASTLESQLRVPKFGVMPMTEVVDALKGFVREAEDETLCHDMCKDMYFCNRRRGHKSQHSEDEMLFWGRFMMVHKWRIVKKTSNGVSLHLWEECRNCHSKRERFGNPKLGWNVKYKGRRGVRGSVSVAPPCLFKDT